MYSPSSLVTSFDHMIVDEQLRLLAEELRATVVPLADALNCSIAIQTQTQFHSLTADCGCHCEFERTTAGPTFSCHVDRKSTWTPIEREGTCHGYCRICAPQLSPEHLAALSKLVEAILQKIALTKQESLLLLELGDCWESLEAIYDTHTFPTASRSIVSSIEQILQRVMSADEGLHAALWVERDGHLDHFGPKEHDDYSVPIDDSTAIRTAITDQRSAFIDSPAAVLNRTDLPAECGGAGRVFIIPVLTRHGTRGALVMWGESGGKPFDSRILRQTQALATQAVITVEGDRLYRSAVENELLQQELEIGARMQQMLLIGSQPSAQGFARVTSLILPSQRVGGDFVEFFPHHDYCLDILIGDVMGKGLRASLVSAAVVRQFHRTICSLVSSELGGLPVPEKIVSLVHAEIARLLAEFESFVTLDFARIDARRARLDFVDCGHTPILHFRHNTGICQPIRGQSMPLGFSASETYEQVSVSFDESDLFIFCSDGVLEVRSPEGEFFGLGRLIALIEKLGTGLSPEELTKSIRDSLASFARMDRFDDDLTLVVVETHIVPISEQESRTVSIEINSDLERLEDVRSFARSVCNAGAYPSLNRDRVLMLELAVTEAASNIMIHAYGGECDRWIRLEGETSDEGVLIRFMHTGEPFDPSIVEKPALGGMREGGYGVYLIDQSVDEVFYVNNGRGLNAITLIQKRQISEAGVTLK